MHSALRHVTEAHQPGSGHLVGSEITPELEEMNKHRDTASDRVRAVKLMMRDELADL
jgi:hypothetical protein